MRMETTTELEGRPERAGRPESFEEFYLEHRDRLFRALLVVTRDRHEADELVQESFARVWAKWDRVRAMDNPAGYLFRVGLNTHRKATRRARQSARRVLVDQSSAGQDPIAEVDAREVLDRAILLLTPRQRAALIATNYLGLDSAEAGRALGVRPGTVRRLVSQARASLKEILSEGGGANE